jgi:hypothetical protein
MAKTQSHERPYHHGDLRRAIVNAALDILRETQSLEFSLRELARRAGVSHNAPYRKHSTRTVRRRTKSRMFRAPTLKVDIDNLWEGKLSL